MTEHAEALVEAPYGSVRHTAAPPAPEAAPSTRREPLPLSRLDEITVRDLMTPGVITISEDASLRQGLRAIAAHGTHAILVVGRSAGRPVGWLTDRGLLSRIASSDAGLEPVGTAISEQIVIVTPGTTAREAVVELSRAGTTHLLVASAAGAVPEGVVSALDLVRATSS